MTVKPLNLTLYLVLDPDLCSQSVGIVETALAAVRSFHLQNHQTPSLRCQYRLL